MWGHKETNDLIYEGIATFHSFSPSNLRYSETNDLIYEGIATPESEARTKGN